MAQTSLHAAVQPKVGDRGQLGLQQVVLHDVQHAFELAEDKHAVLRHHRLCAAIGAAAASTQATVQKQLVKGRRERRQAAFQRPLDWHKTAELSINFLASFHEENCHTTLSKLILSVTTCRFLAASEV